MHSHLKVLYNDLFLYQPGFGYQQQLVPGMRPGGNPMPNFFVPMVQQGRLRPERYISHRLPLSQGSEAYAILDRREALKVVMSPD